MVFVISVLSVISANPAIDPLACGCLSCLRHFRHFRDSRRFREKHRISGVARVRLADLNGPKWSPSGQNGPKWTTLVHFGLANAKVRFGIRSVGPKWTLGPFWTILVQYTFRQYRGHSLELHNIGPEKKARKFNLCTSTGWSAFFFSKIIGFLGPCEQRHF